MITEIISGCNCCGYNCDPNNIGCCTIITFGSMNTSFWQNDPEDYSIGIFKFNVNGVSDDNVDIVVNNQIIGTVIGHIGPPPNCGFPQYNGGLFLPQGLSSINSIPCPITINYNSPSYFLNTYKNGVSIFNSSILNNGKLINSIEVKFSTAIPSDNGCGNYFGTWVFKIKPAII